MDCISLVRDSLIESPFLLGMTSIPGFAGLAVGVAHQMNVWKIRTRWQSTDQPINQFQKTKEIHV
jgi:hypothetical protein